MCSGTFRGYKGACRFTLTHILLKSLWRQFKILKKDKNVQILIDIKTKLHGMKSKYSLFTCEVILSLKARESLLNINNSDFKICGIVYKHVQLVSSQRFH